MTIIEEDLAEADDAGPLMEAVAVAVVAVVVVVGGGVELLKASLRKLGSIAS